MPPARKPENRGLPARWQFYHGAYYYRVPPGREHLWDGKKRFPLGKNLAAAHKLYAQRIDTVGKIHTIGSLLDRYLLEVVPAKAAKTATDNRRQIKRLRAVFGAVPVSGFRPQFIYQYAEKRGKKTAAKREIEVLSHAFTKAVEWGAIDRHPFKGQVRLEGEASRTRYVEDWEILEILALVPSREKGSVLMVQAYIRLKLLTGMARSDMLRLQPELHCKEDGIHVQRHKTAKSTGKRTIYEWTPDRQQAYKDALAACPAPSAFLFCKADGSGYFNETTGEAKAFDHMWANFMRRVLAETKVKERFTEHDLRAKVGSDAESLERARALLQHATSATTLQIYRRKPERV